MRVVLDTNVIVSGLLSPDGPPARLLQAALRGELSAVMDERMLAEAQEVLTRSRFATRIGPARAEDVLRALRAVGEVLDDVPSYTGPMRDESDRTFLEVALAADALLVTGNRRDYPTDAGVEVMTPAHAVRRLLAG